MSDAQIKEVSLLREYASRLGIFKDVILAGCAGLLYKAESTKDDIQNVCYRIESDVNYYLAESNRVIRNYENLVKLYHLTTVNSDLLGSTATDAKEKMEQLKNCADDINSKATRIKTLLTALEERTGVYTLAVRDMSEKGCEQLIKRCSILEQYKEQ